MNSLLIESSDGQISGQIHIHRSTDVDDTLKNHRDALIAHLKTLGISLSLDDISSKPINYHQFLGWSWSTQHNRRKLEDRPRPFVTYDDRPFDAATYQAPMVRKVHDPSIWGLSDAYFNIPSSQDNVERDVNFKELCMEVPKAGHGIILDWGSDAISLNENGDNEMECFYNFVATIGYPQRRHIVSITAIDVRF